MSLATSIVLVGALALVLLGYFIGHAASERTLEARSRRQAVVQRRLNEQAQILRATQVATQKAMAATCREFD